MTKKHQLFVGAQPIYSDGPLKIKRQLPANGIVTQEEREREIFIAASTMLINYSQPQGPNASCWQFYYHRVDSISLKRASHRRRHDR